MRVDPATHRSFIRDRAPLPGSAWTYQTCDEELTAWSYYFELFAGWRPGPLRCASLQVVPTRDFQVPGLRLSATEQELLAADAEVEVDADHISMLLERAPETAALMDAWLAARAVAESPPASPLSTSANDAIYADEGGAL